MKETPADASAPTQAAPEAPPGRELPSKGWLAESKRSEGWSRQRWLTLVALVFTAQVALIFALGEKKFPPPRAVTNVPQFTLADTTNELIALDDPTLFALPHADDFASQMYSNPLPDFRWKEPPGEMPLAAENLGADFARFIRTNPIVAPLLDFKPEPKLSEPVLPLLPAFAGNSALHIEGELAQRQLLVLVELPSLPYSDVIAPSTVQALVDAAGSVVSAVLLPPDDVVESAGHPDVGDTNALRIARSLRFAPSSRLTVGELVFDWHTVPPPATNPPAAAP
jgi:hypothetical protein